MTGIEIRPETTMEAILQVYPSAKVGLFQRYHIGGCLACRALLRGVLEAAGPLGLVNERG